jgi:hypothetical protein
MAAVSKPLAAKMITPNSIAILPVCQNGNGRATVDRYG